MFKFYALMKNRVNHVMRLFQRICSISLLAFITVSCQTTTEKAIEGLTEENETQNIAATEKEGTINEEEPVSCIDWIGYYGKGRRELDSIIDKKSFKIKIEGYDKYGSADKLEGIYVLTDKSMPIDQIGNLAKYLAYTLCLSDNNKFKGVLMDCQRRKIQVAIARSEQNHKIEAWAVVFNIFPSNKRGELILMDYTK